VRLGRLAVDRQYQSKILGKLLLIDALTRARRVYAEAKRMGLFVDALGKPAAGCHCRFRFEAAPDHPRLLFLSAKGMAVAGVACMYGPRKLGEQTCRRRASCSPGY